jgi:sodium transport system permease protein
MSSRPSHVALTLGKELRETLRDRRTLAVMVLFPLVVYPLLSLMVSQVVATRAKTRGERTSTVAVEGADASADDLRRRIRAASKQFVLAGDGTADQVRAGRLDGLVRVTPNADPATRRRTVEIIYDAAREESRQAEDRLAGLIDAAVPDDCLRFEVRHRDLATRAKLGGYMLSKALPLAVVLMVLLGAFYPAIDVTAGERERGTIETVLATPVRRFDLLLGKVLAVSTIAAITGLLNLGSMSVTLVQAVHLADGREPLPVPWSHAALAALVVLPAAFQFSSVFVAVGSIARGFKEAQNLLMPIYLLGIAPALVGAVGEYPLRGIEALVPGMNITLLARDLMLGQASVGGTLAVLGATALFGALALALAARVYDSERMIEPREARSRSATGSPDHGDPRPTTGQALGVYAVAFVLLYFLFIPWQQRDLVRGLMASQLIGMLGLTVALARLTRRRWIAMVAFNRPAPSALAGAVLIGASAWAAVGVLSEWVIPVPRDVLEQLRRAVVPHPLLVALLPAVCEEALFRGVVLRGLARRLAPGAAVLVTGALFGLFHMDPWRLLPTSVLGVLLSFVALESGSIVPAMIAHLLNNGLVVMLAARGLDDRLAHLGHGGSIAIFVVSLALTACGVWLVRRGGAGRQV